MRTCSPPAPASTTKRFAGPRAYWNEDQEQLYGLKMLEHFKRLTRSAKVLLMKPPLPPEGLVELRPDDGRG